MRLAVTERAFAGNGDYGEHEDIVGLGYADVAHRLVVHVEGVVGAEEEGIDEDEGEIGDVDRLKVEEGLLPGVEEYVVLEFLEAEQTGGEAHELPLVRVDLSVSLGLDSHLSLHYAGPQRRKSRSVCDKRRPAKPSEALCAYSSIL